MYIETSKYTFTGIKKGQRLRKEWGDKPSCHPCFEKETQGQVLSHGYAEEKTGDYICTQCGETFTKAEKDEIEANRATKLSITVKGIATKLFH